MSRLNLQRAILGAVAVALLAGVVQAGIAVDRRLESTLEERASNDLALAPQLFKDRIAMTADAMMMSRVTTARLRVIAKPTRGKITIHTTSTKCQ